MPSVGPMNAGFKQTAAAYLSIVSSVNVANFLTYTPGTGSGGGFLPGSFASYPTLPLGSLATPVDLSTALKAGNTLKDMGRTVVSSSRVFRKVQVMAPAGTGVPAINGSVPNAPDYLTAYLEVAGENGQAVNALARF